MDRVYDLMVAFLTEDDWKFNPHEDSNAVTFGFKGANGSWQCVMRAREKEQQVLFYSQAPINCPEELRPQMSEFLTRANYGMIIGNFEMDWSDGEIRYKTSVDIEGVERATAIIKNLVYPNIQMMDRYLPGVLGLVYGNLSAEEAIKRVEEVN